MEWKTDEKLMVRLANEAARTGEFPTTGMKSGGGIVNPGMSVEVFGLVSMFTDDPLDMVRAVQWANVIALVGFMLLARRYVQGEERVHWQWGLVIAAVNPLAVLFSRKIWAQDLLPLLALVLVFGHLERKRWWGALLWGLGGVLMGQVHMSGFFLAFGVLVVTVVHDRVNGAKVHWIAWAVGSVLGGLTLLPWVLSLAEASGSTTTSWTNVFQLNFFAYWVIDALGIDLLYSFRDGFWDFVRWPLVGGVPTYLVAIAHVALLLIGLRAVRNMITRGINAFRALRAARPWHHWFRGMSVTRLYLLGILIGLGIGMPLAGVMVYQHYLICAFPFAYIFLAQALARERSVKNALLVAQLLITAMALWYVHTNDGVADGDYGVTYRAQTERSH